jgi:dihydrofolate reductase
VLPGRPNLVISRDAGFEAPGAQLLGSLDAARARGQDLAGELAADSVCVIGGGEIYRAAMAVADRLELTEVALAPAGDVRFPAIDPALWVEVARRTGERGARDEADFAFVSYRRRM